MWGPQFLLKMWSGCTGDTETERLFLVPARPDSLLNEVVSRHVDMEAETESTLEKSPADASHEALFVSS